MTVPQTLGRVTRPVADPDVPAAPFGLGTVLVWLAAHVVIGVLGHLSPMAATLHCLAASGAVAITALWGRRLDRLVAATLYASLCDVYWRMTQGRAPWEFSKYLLLVGSVAILVRYVERWSRSGLPVAFLACLLVGIVPVAIANSPAVTKDIVSGTEMGLISLGVACLALRQVVASEADGWNLCWVMLGPLTSVAAVTSMATLTASNLEFTNESNFAVTGGFGPNQVSSILGLGILLCVFLGYQRRGWTYLGVLAPLGAWMLWGAFLTFSRGGVAAVVVAGAALLLVGLNTRGVRTRSLVIGVVAVIALLAIFASVNSFSGNFLDSRYGERQDATAGRANLATEDLRVWSEHPLLGVGSGQSPRYHQGNSGYLDGAAPHTEFTRLLAEHGLGGLVAIGLLVAMFVTGLGTSRGQWNRIVVAGSGVWAATTMMHAATRIGAVSALFALTQLQVEADLIPRPRLLRRPTSYRAAPRLAASAADVTLG